MDSECTIKDRLRKFWKYYLLQSFLATVAVLILTCLLGRDKMVAVSAIGATTFIVFAMPNTASAKPKNVIGSHLVGLAAGSIFCLTSLPYLVECPLAVGIAILLMVTLGVVHPPAAGTALAVAINEVPLDAFITIVVGTVVLSLCRHYLKDHLKNLV